MARQARVKATVGGARSPGVKKPDLRRGWDHDSRLMVGLAGLLWHRGKSPTVRDPLKKTPMFCWRREGIVSEANFVLYLFAVQTCILMVQHATLYEDD